jgi:hypothetical protein
LKNRPNLGRFWGFFENKKEKMPFCCCTRQNFKGGKKAKNKFEKWKV